MLYSELQCSEAIHKAVERMGFAEMTEIQEKTIPVMLAGRGQLLGDLLGKLPTLCRRCRWPVCTAVPTWKSRLGVWLRAARSWWPPRAA